jgi:hypothetical protein
MAANIAKLPELLRGPPPIKRGVTRLQPHISRQSAQCRLAALTLGRRAGRASAVARAFSVVGRYFPPSKPQALQRRS